ncbi:hypothetical protein GCM10010517_74130 [Streptosporangium fragile]|uniref:Uncharacterized protein n=2 Tax=Streptosporangium fragile TaxID=46186 RepID=A0ABN3WC52_9ACTN
MRRGARTTIEETVTANGRRFGHIVGRMPLGSGQRGSQGTYVVRDAEAGTHHSFMYADTPRSPPVSRF